MPITRINDAVHALQRGVERLDAELASLERIAASSDLPVTDETCDRLAADVRNLAREVDKVMVRIRAERRDRQDQPQSTAE